MEMPGSALPEAEAHLERQLVAQERQIVLLRFAVVVLAAVAALLLRHQLPAPLLTLGVIGAVAVYNAVLAVLVGRFPTREVGVLSIGLDFVAVTLGVYTTAGHLEAHLLYAIVILGVALRFGLVASVWSSVVAAFLYTGVTLIAGGDVALTVLPSRLVFFVAMGLAGGLFSRVVISRTLENATLQRRLDEEAARQRVARESEVLGQASRDFGASLGMDDVLRAVVHRSAEALGDVAAVFLADAPGHRLSVRAIHARRADDAELLRAETDTRTIDGAVSRAFATASTQLEDRHRERSPGEDHDPFAAIGARSWLAVPMVARHEVVGVLAAAVLDGERPLGDDELRLAEELAARAASAVENARLWADLQQRVGQLEALQQVVADITRNLAVEEILEHLTESLQRVFGADRAAIYLQDAASRRTFCGASRNVSDAFVQATLSRFIDSPGGLAIAAGRPILLADARSDPRLAWLDGAMRTEGVVTILAAPLVHGGVPIGAMVLLHDAPRRYDDPEVALVETFASQVAIAIGHAALFSRERLAQRVKDDFLSIVSHELRTPLTSIHGYSQLLEARLRAASGTSKELTHLAVIRSQAARMGRLVDDLLDVSRIDRPGGLTVEIADIDLAAEVRAAAGQMQRNHAERRVVLEAPERLMVEADRDRIEQVLTNLLDNAVKYSPEGGPITIRAWRDGHRARVTVADEGIGISPEHAAHIFERFYQVDGDTSRRRFGGLGLGLYISQAIVDSHAGAIWAEPNRAGRGSVFGFWIPVRSPLRAAGQRPEYPIFGVPRRRGAGSEPRR